MEPTIAQQLRAAWLKSGLSLEDLIARSGLDISVPSMSKKLAGQQILTTAEAEAIARALELRIEWPKRKRPAA